MSKITMQVIQNNDVFTDITQEDVAPGVSIFTLRKNAAVVEITDMKNTDTGFVYTFSTVVDDPAPALMEIVFEDEDVFIEETIVENNTRAIKIFMMTGDAADKSEITTIV